MAPIGKTLEPVTKSLMQPAVNDSQEVVYTISRQTGWFTTNSGRKYKSYGLRTKWVIAKEDRPSLEAMGLIAPLV